jgi:hypothetical protein
VGDLHLTIDLLRAFEQGDVPADSLGRIGLAHLSSCWLCVDRLRTWRKEREAGDTPQRRLSRLLLIRGKDSVPRQSYEINRDARELLRAPQGERLLKVDRSIHRFRGTMLAAVILRESRERMETECPDPEEAYSLAEVGLAILRRTAAEPGVTALTALAAAYGGSALRALGQLEEATARFEYARYLVEREGVGDPLVLAEIDHCEAPLARDLHRAEDAVALRQRSTFLYTLAGDRARGLPIG